MVAALLIIPSDIAAPAGTQSCHRSPGTGPTPAPQNPGCPTRDPRGRGLGWAPDGAGRGWGVQGTAGGDRGQQGIPWGHPALVLPQRPAPRARWSCPGPAPVTAAVWPSPATLHRPLPCPLPPFGSQVLARFSAPPSLLGPAASVCPDSRDLAWCREPAPRSSTQTGPGTFQSRWHRGRSALPAPLAAPAGTRPGDQTQPGWRGHHPHAAPAPPAHSPQHTRPPTHAAPNTRGPAEQSGHRTHRRRHGETHGHEHPQHPVTP